MPKEIIMYKRIRDLREDADMTQVQIAKILNCSQRVYSNYERGDIDIPTEILIKLANFHDVSVDYILGRTNKRELNK
jgi:transcriptional regulator with XRE-family HTH domain